VIIVLVGLPIVAGVLAFALRGQRRRRAVLVAAALGHTVLTLWCVASPPAPILEGWIRLDPLGLLFLTLASILFLAASVYCVAYLRHEEERTGHESERVFIACLLFFLAAMTLATSSHHLGLLWVAIEATTLSSAPLIYFHRGARSLEATWKYLLICSVGIALALMGTFCLALAGGDGMHVPLVLDNLVAAGATLDARWVQVAFLLLLVGYGTKMGLSPLHTWLPDAHSEAPSPVSALLSGALLNCAFLGILRGLQICSATGIGEFARELLVGFGILSMSVAAIFLLRPVDYKRMLAYSSVEHMGILAVGVGLGASGAAAAMFHAVNHSLGKGMLFLVAGNILSAYGTKSVDDVRGVLRTVPVSGVLWVAGFLAIAGSPPFGSFLSEFTILRAAVLQGRGLVVVAYLVLLSLAFIGMAGAFLRMAQGPARDTPAVRESRFALLPPAILGVTVLALGFYVPPALRSAFESVARALGGSP
jgi:hydrogenase-4 component F